MMAMFWLLFFVAGACLVLLMPMVRGWALHRRYSGSRAVTCPENRQTVTVSFDAVHAARTALAGRAEARLADCTRWPERGDCNQACIPQALRTAAYGEGEAEHPAAKKVYHLTVLLAGFAAWVLGATWHSPFLFRAQWMEALGLTRMELRQSLLWLPGHFVSLGACLLFAYGVAALLAWRNRKGVWQGMATSALLWLAIAAASLLAAQWSWIPSELLKIEAAYTLLASLLAGAVIGGLSGRITVRRASLHAAA